MNCKKIVFLIIGLLTMTIMSCSKQSDNTELFKLACDDAGIVARINAAELLESGEYPFEGTSLDLTTAMFTEYDDDYFIVAKILDVKELDRLLVKEYQRMESVDGFVVYKGKGKSKVFVSNGEYLWLSLSEYDVNSVVDKVKTALVMSKPLSPWKLDYIFGSKDAAVAGILVEKNQTIVCTAEINESKLTLEAFAVDPLTGERCQSDESKIEEVLPKYAKYLAENDVLAFAVDGNSYIGESMRPILALLQYRYLSSEEISLASNMTGSMFASVNLADPQGEIYDFMNYQAVVGLEFSDDKADVMLDNITGLMPMMWNKTADGYRFYIEDFIDLNARTEDDCVVLSMQPCDNRRILAPDDLAGCTAWGTVNLSPEMTVMKMADIPYGIRARIYATDISAEVELQFVDANHGFVYCLIDTYKKLTNL